MKKIFLFFLICIFFIVHNVFAETFKVYLTYDAVSLREEPSGSSKLLDSVYSGISFYMADQDVYPDEGKSCSDGWYKVKYEDGYGYLCKKYVDVVEIDEEKLASCKTEMVELGFPESYVNDLCEIKQRYPKWNFIPLKVDIDFQTVVDNESTCGSSYVYTDEEENIDKTCNNVYKTTGIGWYPASKKIVAYYMDPRNFLNERYLFQFESLYYNDKVSDVYSNAVISILKNTSFYNYHVDNGEDFSGILNNASSDAKISPIFISSRMKQELGSTTKLYNLYSGTYEGFEGYYNFYNFRVTDECATSKGTSVCGLTYAKNMGWDSLYNAIYGGASILKSSYLDAGQHVNYLQKFNVSPKSANKLYIHQYMTNISGPSSESTTMYTAYLDNNGISNAFTFYIPVYNNMSTNIDNSSSGAVDDGNKSSVNSADIPTIITSSGFKISYGYFSGIAPETDTSTIISSIEAVGGIATIVDANGNDYSGTVGTGMKITVKNDTKSEEYFIVVNGDSSGDGKISALDLAQVQKYLLGTFTLSDAYFYAADSSDDNTVSAIDLAQIQKNILGSFEIAK